MVAKQATCPLPDLNQPNPSADRQTAPSTCVLLCEAEQVTGIFTAWDVICLVAKQATIAHLILGEIAHQPATTRHASELTDQLSAIHLLQQQKASHLPIVDQSDQLLGLLTETSVGQFSQPLAPLRLQSVAALMCPAVYVTPDCTILAIAQLMADHDTSSVVVVTFSEAFPEPLNPAEQRPIGLITAADVVQLVSLAVDLSHVTASQVIGPIVTVNPEDSLWLAHQRMSQDSFRPLVVTGPEGNLLGQLSQHDLLQGLNPLALYQLSEHLAAQLPDDTPLLVELPTRQPIEAQLHASKQRYASLVEASPVGILHINFEGICIYANDRYCEILGVEPVAIIGQPWSQCCLPKRQLLAQPELQQSLCATHPIAVEYSIDRPDGTEVWVYAQSAVDNNVAAQGLGQIITFTDISDRKQTEIALQKLIEGTATTTGENFFPALVTHIAAALDVAHVLVSELHGETLQVLAHWGKAALVSPFVYPVANTPCERVLQDGQFYCEADIQQAFPNDLAIIPADAASYLGIVLRDRQGHPIGNLCLFNQAPIRNFARVEKLMTIFAARAAAELERQQATQALARFNQDLENRVAERTAALQASQRRYTSLAAAVPVAIFRFDTPLNCVYVNDRWCQMTGRSAESAMEYGWLEALHPDDRVLNIDQWNREYAQARLETLIIHGTEARHIHTDGRIIWCHVNVAQELDDNGNVVGYVGTLTDITDRKTAELSLQASQSQFQRMTENVPGMIYRYVLHPDGTDQLTYVSSQIREVFEVEPATALQDVAQVWARIHPDDIPWLGDAIRESAATLTPFTSTYRLCLPHKGRRWVQNFSHAERLGNGDVVWDGIVSDITDRQQQEQERERLLEIIESTSDYIAVTDAEGYILWRNQALKKFQPDLCHLDHRIHFSVGHPEWANEIIQNQALPIAIEQGTWSGELALTDAAGNEVIVSQVLIAHKSATGKVEYFSTIIRDIRDQKATEQALTVKQNHLEALLNNIPHIAWIKDADSRFIAVNQPFAQACGTAAETIIGKTDFDFWPTELAQIYRNDDFQVLQSNYRKVVEERIARADGTLGWLETTKTPFRDAHGVLSGTVGIAADITDRKTTELALKASEEKFQRITNSVPGMIYRYVLHPDGSDGFAYISPQVQQLYELEPAVVLQDTSSLWARIHPDDVPRIQQAVQDSAECLTPFWVEERLVLPEAGLKWVQINARPERQENGDVIWDGIVVDITDRKVAEAQTNQHLAAIEAAINGIAILHADRYIYLNQAHYELLGYTPAELLGQSWQKLYSVEVLERFEQEIFPLLQRDRAWQGEVIATRKDGSCFDQSLSLTLLDHNLLICVFSDISVLKQTAMALEQEVLRRSTVFNASPDGIHILDRVGNLLEANASFGQMLGYSLDELSHLNVADWDAQWSDTELQAKFQNYSAIPSSFETLHRRKDGLIFPVEITQCSMEWEGDVSLVCIARDISQRKQAEIQLQQTNEQLARATQLKDEFLANMSHELRTPLNAILGLSETLQEAILGPLNDRQLKALKTIEQSGQHLLELINDILDVARVESGQVILDCFPTNLSLLCQSSFAFIRQQALTKCIRLDLQVPTHLPDISLDQRRIRQVLINLLNNAVKFTPEDGQITLEVIYPGDQSIAPATAADRITPDSQTLVIRVIDTGIGIAAENIPKLFQPFIQIDSALNRQYTGTGLGLALVKRIVELHGGQVSLTSELGQGSCFTITLPAVSADADARIIPPEMAIVPDTTAAIATDTTATDVVDQSDNPRILLVEDNEANISTILMYLETKGYCVLVATHGQAAIEMAQSAHPDVILMDIQMPGMDGLEAITHIRQIAELRTVPIIALTALAMPGDEAYCLSVGATAYLAKPVRLRELVIKIQSCLSLGAAAE
ncbi:PAS domain S-box protein [filamentous cyanobacterium LEGE 11480]|uniref:Circadian input-output histidine kinase CikA n=1 Tax=Romeriopsis navalis LEGE 11480 TaxID=2777977 RepID=A0A928VTQ5_9CYAN|nr:PAS domain S-box protein [Romeriopsis navalis]MBE9032069.1 PAS domain S-box protein [Romeriopsis navalis LEGE 11480]